MEVVSIETWGFTYKTDSELREYNWSHTMEPEL